MLRAIQNRHLDYFFILLIAIVVLSALLFKIGDIPPPYPWSDESEIAADAVATLRHGPRLFYPDQLAGGSLAVWLEAGWMALFGRGLVGLRVLNGLVNVATAVLIYLLARQLPLAGEPHHQRLTALSAALLFAVSTWLLGLGRIATPNWSLVGLMTALAFYLFWRALHTRRRRYLMMCGVVMGLLFYGYIPGYFVPLVPALFLMAAWLINNHLPITNDHLPLTKFPLLPASYSLLPFFTTLLVAAPILIFFALHPIAALQRPLQLADTNELSPGASLLGAAIDTLSTSGLYPNWLWQGRFERLAFDPLVTVLFVAGVLVSLWRWREPGYLFLLIWWGVMMAPAVLSRSASQGFIFDLWRRGVGAQPASFMLAAVGLQALVSLMPLLHAYARTQRSGRAELSGSKAVSLFTRSFAYPLVMALAVGVSALLGYRLYFGQWANSGAIPILFAESPVRMVDWMVSRSNPQTAFIFPIRPNVSPTTRPELFTVRYLYNGPSITLFPAMDEQSVGDSLAELLRAKPATVKLMMSSRVEVDPKGYFEYALGLRGRAVSQERLPDYRITTYQMQVDEPTLPKLAPADVNFGDALRLTGQRIGSVSPLAGQSLSVALRWQTQIEPDADYNASLILLDSQGGEVVRLDKPLLSAGDYLTTRHWPPGDESTHYFALPIPADTPPGRHSLSVTLYNAQTGAQLLAAGSLLLRLAEVEIQPALADPATLQIPQSLDITFPGGLALKGVNVAAVYRPGDRPDVLLWWQAAEKIEENIGLALALAQLGRDPVPLMAQPRPLIEGYLTPDWPPGSTYRARYRLLLPASLPGGDYSLALRLIDLTSGETLADQLLAPLAVEARQHQFDAPPPAHQLEADFGDTIRLRGFELSGAAPGQTLELKVQWQALREMSVSYKIFLHLTDSAGRVLSQVDTLPQQGHAPTTGWVSGEIIEDELRLTIPAELSAGSHRLVIGWYDETTGRRLKAGEGDQVTLVDIN